MTTTRRIRITVLAGLTALGTLGACGDDDAPDDDATVTLTAPATAAGAVHVTMAADGLEIEPAGDVHEGAGHFHVIADAGCVSPGAAIARDADHVHIGDGSAEATLYLEPGEHELCLQVGDGAHVALDATDTATVEVGITDQQQWCAVVGEVDELFAANTIGSHDFAEAKAGAEQLRRLLAQVTEAMGFVDEDARDAVAEEVGFAAALVSAYTSADDFEAAEAAVEELFQDQPEDRERAGADWILDTCDVDIAD